jgi:hypothetical protein
MTLHILHHYHTELITPDAALEVTCACLWLLGLALLLLLLL